MLSLPAYSVSRQISLSDLPLHPLSFLPPILLHLILQLIKEYILLKHPSVRIFDLVEVHDFQFETPRQLCVPVCGHVGARA